MIGSLGSFTNTESWVEQAICASADPEAFFPNPGASCRDAKSICYRCPVRKECLAYALANNEIHGVWGGFSERERRRVRQGKPAKRTHCQRGHELAVVGTISNNNCRRCRQIWEAAYKLRRGEAS